MADRLVCANAYLGARPIAEAIGGGARVVVTGRVADASLTVGPAVAAFDWGWEDWPTLAGASVAGHLIECGAQATGGLWYRWDEIDDFAGVGYPIAEIAGDGTSVLTKPEGSGGLVTVANVAEQIVYEIGDPTAYKTPDIDVDLTSVELSQVGPDRVAVMGCQGRPPSDTLKVSAVYRDGYTASGMVAVVGRDAESKARAAGRVVLERVRLAGFELADSLVEVLGSGDVVRGHGPAGVASVRGRAPGHGSRPPQGGRRPLLQGTRPPGNVRAGWDRGVCERSAGGKAGVRVLADVGAEGAGGGDGRGSQGERVGGGDVVKGPRVRLADLVEWVVAIAVGLAVMRWIAADPFDLELERISGRYRDVVFSILAGVAVVEGLVLSWETVRRRGPAMWGPGRWVWAATGLFLLISVSLNLIVMATRDESEFVVVEGQANLPGDDSEIVWVFRSSLSGVINTFCEVFPAGVMIAGLASAWAGWPRDPHPDPRERAGQFFAAMLVGEAIVWNGLVITGI